MKRFFLNFSVALLAVAPMLVQAADLCANIPVLNVVAKGFMKVPNVAQYKDADWSQVIGIAKDISLKEAVDIANGNEEITYFFYMKGNRMVLETIDGNYRVFRKGDAVFFAGEPWWGSAPGFADGYVKQVE